MKEILISFLKFHHFINFQCMKKLQTLSLHDQRLKNKVHESCSSSPCICDVQRQPVIGGVNWQIQYKSSACSLSSSPSKARSLNREWILSCCLNPWIASCHSANIPMLHPTPMCQEEKQPTPIQWRQYNNRRMTSWEPDFQSYNYFKLAVKCLEKVQKFRNV